jgi:hypothetical protein
MSTEKPDWAGRTVVCIASGPSLTAEDCETVRASGHPVVVTNTTFRLCPWADVLFAFDAKWWTMYHEEVKRVFKGRRLSFSQAVRHMAVESTYMSGWFHNFGNSGACAIAIAIASGADKIVLLGYDCQKTGGAAHWHGNHPQGLSNALSLDRWPGQFKNVAMEAKNKGAVVINASRETALKCFERQVLEDAL